MFFSLTCLTNDFEFVPAGLITYNNEEAIMSHVKVMTDTVSSITPKLATDYNIKVVPAANIEYDGQLYLDGVGITTAKAYQLLERDPDKFSARTLSPGDFMEYFREASQESNDILHISFSSALSGTSKLAVLGAEQLQKEQPQINIRVFDSKTAAGAQGLLAIAAAKAAATEMDLTQVLKFVEQSRPKTGGIMMLDTLRYVYRTGRMSKTAARLVSLFNVKPINWMTSEGTLEMIGRTRKREEGYSKLMDYIKKEAKTDSLHFIVSHANAPEIGEHVSDLLRENFNCLSLTLAEYSPIMGYAVGPGCIFIGFQPELVF
jgi:DegV family protein with EDD domain